MSDGEFLRHDTCPKCGGSDCLAVYSDGGNFCFGTCFSFIKTDDTPDFVTPKKKKSSKMAQDIAYGQLKSRGGIAKKICEKYGYGRSKYDFMDEETEQWETKTVMVANYYNPMGSIIAQKIRTANKDFKFVGTPDKTLLWGRHLWRNKGGRKIIITEGEIDCLSVAHCYDGKYPVVSISTGAKSAKKCLIGNLEFLESFDQIVLWFDSDEVGQEALEECKGLFSPKKLYYIPFDSINKDANDVLKNEGRKGVIERLYEAVEYREDAIVRGSEINFNQMRENIRQGRGFPYPKLTSMTMGLREAELLMLTSGSGMGKSTLAIEIIKHQLDTDPEVNAGLLLLEEGNEKSYNRFMALDNDVPLKNLRIDHDLISEEDAYKTHQKYFANDRICMYNHFGSVDTDKLMQKIRYLHIAEKCDTIVLDHISIAVSGLKSEGNDVKTLDVFMTNMRSFVEETGCSIIAIVHLKRSKGKSFNEGAKVSLNDLKGASSIEQLSDTVIALERDQQGAESTLALIRVLKCRETGETGIADTIEYIKNTGRYMVYNEENPTNQDVNDNSDAF